MISPALLFFLKIVLAIWGLLRFYINFRIICSSSLKNVIDILVGIALNLIALGSINNLTILSLQIHEQRYLSISLNRFQFSSQVFYSFQSISLSPSWLSLFLGILYFLM